MLNGKIIVAGAMWTALLVGCSSESRPSAEVNASRPLADASNAHVFTSQMAAGDSLGRKIFAPDRVAGGSTIISTRTASIAE